MTRRRQTLLTVEVYSDEDGRNRYTCDSSTRKFRCPGRIRISDIVTCYSLFACHRYLPSAPLFFSEPSPPLLDISGQLEWLCAERNHYSGFHCPFLDDWEILSFCTQLYLPTKSKQVRRLQIDLVFLGPRVAAFTKHPRDVGTGRTDTAN